SFNSAVAANWPRAVTHVATPPSRASGAASGEGMELASWQPGPRPVPEGTETSGTRSRRWLRTSGVTSSTSAQRWSRADDAVLRRYIRVATECDLRPLRSGPSGLSSIRRWISRSQMFTQRCRRIRWNREMQDAGPAYWLDLFTGKTWDE